MKENKLYIGKAAVVRNQKTVEGGFVDIDGKRYYKISNYDLMSDFFMSVVSDADHWTYISSNGSLSAGRVDRNNALFPYYTEDKIHDYKGRTGSSTYMVVTKDGCNHLWEPFSDNALLFYNVSRNLYKSVYSNSILFEEINHDLGLQFRYSWSNSARYGFVKESVLTNPGEPMQVRILDGLKNILPSGTGYGFQNEYSNLLDAYKKSELLDSTPVGLFALSSIPVDKAEPSEALRATMVWSTPLSPNTGILISEDQIRPLLAGEPFKSIRDVRGRRGAYYLYDEIIARGITSWITVADINKSMADVNNLLADLSMDSMIRQRVTDDINLGTRNLIRLVDSADGAQMTDTEVCYVRHFNNVLYNIMRGGVFTDNDRITAVDLGAYLRHTNKELYLKHTAWLQQLPTTLTYTEACDEARRTGDGDLLRITTEYLPLTFSRRHGDPSRPWNVFSIRTRDAQGNPTLNYEGNWRDIFQNWEALAHSFPAFTPGMIARFLNATTADGYNPYRITRQGIDWEVPDPKDPWSYIGYWGDHQIIYLQKLLEVYLHHNPGHLAELLKSDNYVYAHVPYRIKTYGELVSDPNNTIDFDFDLHEKLVRQSKEQGADGKLLHLADGTLYHVNFTEKLMVTILAKLSNFVPGAGLWMNTQRPEWNDANNALVGNGASMVTLYYLRRMLSFWKAHFAGISGVPVSETLVALLMSINQTFLTYRSCLTDGLTDELRKAIADQLGMAHSDYRTILYQKGFSGKKMPLTGEQISTFMELALQFIDQTISLNRREDGLYHAYNLIRFHKKGITIRYLYEMLEGQVAVLSSGFLNPGQGLEVLNALKNSALFREDQFSYILYPDRQLARFNEKNVIAAADMESSPLLQQLLATGDTSIVMQDLRGQVHFHPDFRNAAVLKAALDKLNLSYAGNQAQMQKEQVLALYEKIFDHSSFTGRSGTFYGYEGLGSIYWHMVSKLLLATQELFFEAVDTGTDAQVISHLKQHYYEIKAGIGLYKSPAQYGSFPTDAYSHTPGGAGVKQPGLTGQVKEDVISRFGEMGVRVHRGELHFDSSLINHSEILSHEATFRYYDIHGRKQSINLLPGQIASTLCQVPVVLSYGENPVIRMTTRNGQTTLIDAATLPGEWCSLIFSRSGEVSKIEVFIKMSNE